MSSENRLIKLIKKIALQTYNSIVPCNFLIGTVVNINPIKIKISDKIVLEEIHLYILDNAEGTFKTDMTVEGINYKGNCKHELTEGARVVLGRCMGGTKYVLLGGVK